MNPARSRHCFQIPRPILCRLQKRRFFHGYYDGYYDCYCYLPLYVSCGHDLAAAFEHHASAAPWAARLPLTRPVQRCN
jgi:hypothetical protein